MPHFMVRKKVNGNPAMFRNSPQTGKRFFYQLDALNHLIDTNTVINYEATLELIEEHFNELIRYMTGVNNPTQQSIDYQYHLDKSKNLIDINYCVNTLELPNHIDSYSLSTIAVAADYSVYKARGNFLIIYRDNNNPNNELCISIHLKYPNKSQDDINQLKNFNINLEELKKLLADAVTTTGLHPENPIWNLKPWDNFNNLGYVVTGGNDKEKNYKNAYNAYTLRIFEDVLPKFYL